MLTILAKNPLVLEQKGSEFILSRYKRRIRLASKIDMRATLPLIYAINILLFTGVALYLSVGIHF